ncbi:anti-phage dCTP deaminase [Pseudomonas sp. Je.1.5.c]|uniref:anti-phage dCTP deaminase n=1 Tax=Pseudomonas sp. Je.1.5.c TaxID=3142839 RepID=UPI003DA9F8F3
MSTGTVKAFPQIGSVEAIEPEAKENLREKIKSRRTKEIVIGVCGAVGCNLQDVVTELKEQFSTFSYEIEYIKISSIIKSYFRDVPPPAKYLGKIDQIESFSLSSRYEALQDLGNHIRNTLGDDALAVQAIKSISSERQIKMNESGDANPPRVVYIVDQLKHPAEVDLFKLVYRNAFFLVGVMSPQQARLEHLQAEGLNSVDAQRLVERDRRDNVDHGQQLEKTIHRADFFVKHSLTNVGNITKPCKRFAGLVHGENGITPTKDEGGMYAAYSASLKSACLSRQVGASITNDSGDVISVGWNDVPAAGGGLYNTESEPDQRCIHHGKKCHNDDTKQKLAKRIVEILTNSKKDSAVKQLSFATAEAQDLTKVILEQTQLGSIIEYSRAIHAEMEAIINIARGGTGNTSGSIMYTTTYPCHNCARHIIAAGISRVVYIEPYEKSLAIKLHGDAITIDKSSSGKVVFENFEGVSPSRYTTLFSFNNRRKESDGSAIRLHSKKEANPISSEHLDSYLDVESKVVDRAVQDSGEQVDFPTVQ